MTLYLNERRAEDTLHTFQARSVLLAIGGRRHVLSPTDAQFLLTELAGLPATRWPAAESARAIISGALANGRPAAFSEKEERVLVRAVEGIRARRKLSPGLSAIRDALLRGTVG
jgi:hypothetical protein